MPSRRSRFVVMLAFLCLSPKNTGILLTIVLNVCDFPQADNYLQLECLAESVGPSRYDLDGAGKGSSATLDCCQARQV